MRSTCFYWDCDPEKAIITKVEPVNGFAGRVSRVAGAWGQRHRQLSGTLQSRHTAAQFLPVIVHRAPLAANEADSPADVVKAQPGCAVENLAGVPYAWVWGWRARERRYPRCRRGRRGIAAEGAGQR
jgi:hypothetical protein